MDYNKIKNMGMNLELGVNSQGLNNVLMEKCIAKLICRTFVICCQNLRTSPDGDSFIENC